MYHKILFWGTTFLCFIGMIFFHRFNSTDNLFQKYQKIGFLQSDFQYKKSVKTWDRQGLIFYQIHFPHLPFEISADKMTFSFNEDRINLDLKNVHIGISKILYQLYGGKITEELENYVPYQDFERKFIISMALMGINNFDGDISIHVFYNDPKELSVEINLTQDEEQLISLKGTLQRPIEGAVQFSDWWQGRIKMASLQVLPALFKKYVYYAQSRGVSRPTNTQENTLILKGEEQLKNIFNSEKTLLQ